MPESVHFVIVTGLSGAGKSQALNCLEDFGFFCVDNLPLAILPRFIELTRSLKDRFKKVALGIDIREGGFFKDFANSLNELKTAGIKYKLIFLDADDQTLIRRYSETRRRHPLGSNILKGIKAERKKLAEIKAFSARIVNTSNLTLSELKEAVYSVLALMQRPGMSIHIVSFGYKFGVPIDSDVVMDVRFMPNPNYVSSLRYLTGRDKPVKRFIQKSNKAKALLKRLKGLFKMLLPLYIKEGKSYLTVCMGCTGGRHRSVYIAEQLSGIIKGLGHKTKLTHRDIEK